MKIYKIFLCLFFISFSVTASETDNSKKSFFLSADAGSIKTTYTCSGGGRLIFHINDAHCKADAQLNIATIIETIINHYGSAVIAVEGAAGHIYAENFRRFPDKKVLSDVSKYFLNKGFLSGSEYYFLNSKKEMPFLGVENPEIYMENYGLIIKAIHARPEALKAVNLLIDRQAEYAESLLNSRQAAFITNWINYNKHELLIDKYVDYLVSVLGRNDKYGLLINFQKIINEESRINFNLVENQRLKFLDWITSNSDKNVIKEVFKWDIRYKLNKISSKEYFKKIVGWAAEYQNGSIDEEYSELKRYADYLFESEKINKTKLYAQLNEAVNDSAQIIFGNEKDFSVFELIKYAYLYKSLISLSINYDKYRCLDENHNFTWFAKNIKLIFPEIQIGSASWKSLEQAVAISRSFYGYAVKRESFMVENCLKEMDNRQIDVGIIVTGGFHEAGISNELKKRQISFCSIEPAIKDSSVETSYFSLVQNLRTPLENWVSGSTLAVASWIAQSPLIDDGTKEIRTTIFSSMLTADYLRKLSPSNINQIRYQLDELVGKANIHLESWLKTYAPKVSLESAEVIGNKLAVHLKVGRGKLVYLFAEPNIPDRVSVAKQDMLEEGHLAGYQIEALAEDIIGKLRQIVRADEISAKSAYSEKYIKSIVKQLGIQAEFEENKLSLSLIDSAVKDYNYRNDTSVNLSQLYQLYKYVMDDFLFSADADFLSDLTGLDLQKNFVSGLDPQDLFDECYNILRSSYSETPVIKVEDLKSDWRKILSARGISAILVDPTLPFESLVSMMFSLVFSPEIEQGTMYLGDMNGKRYYTRLIKLTDGTMFARVGFKDADTIETPFWSVAEYQKSSQLPLPLNEALIALELDGGFILSSVFKIDRRTLKTESTKIRASINGIMRGDEGASQLRDLLKKHRYEAIKLGLYPTGFIVRNQENEPQYFSDIDSVLTYFRKLKGSTYEPVRQSDWTNSAGTFSVAEFEQIAQSNSIRYSDSVDPVDLFAQLDELIPIEGSRILDVGSQTGQNIFYTYLTGAKFSAGLDFNPYNVLIAREISAYIHENEDTSDEAGFSRHTLSQFATMKDGASRGHLYFRTLYLKDIEAESARKISQIPPDNIEFAIGDGRHIQYPSDSFDISNAVNLLQYIDNASLALKEMMRVTRPGGYIQLNYAMFEQDNIDLIKEAVRLFERDESLTLDYKIIELPNGMFPLPLFLIQIKDKRPLIDLSGQVEFIKNHVYKRTYYDNFFDSKPYLSTIYPPVNIIPRELNVTAEGELRRVSDVSGLSKRKKFNLILVTGLLQEMYGTEIFGNLRYVKVEKGQNSFVYAEGGTLIINEVALDNPLILFMQMEQKLSGNIKLTDLGGLTNDPLFPLAYEAASIYRGLINTKNRVSKGELSNLIWSLRASKNPDTDLEKESIMIGALLQAVSDRKIKYDDIIEQILNFIVSRPKYRFLTQLVPAAYQKERLKHNFKTAVKTIAEKLDDNTANSDYFDLLINNTASSAINSDKPTETVNGLFDLFKWKKRVELSSKPLPYNLENLIDNKKIGNILASYPVAGNIIIEDLMKSYLANALYPWTASFLMNMSSVEIIQVIKNIELNYADQPKLIFETLQKAQDLSKLRTVKSIKNILLGDSPLEVLNDQIALKISDENFADDQHWLNFLPYFELLVRDKNNLPDNLADFIDPDKIDEVYRKYPATGFYILTELAKIFLNNPDDKPELPFLSDFSGNEIWSLIGNIDNFVRSQSAQNRYSGILSPLYVPASQFITPLLHNYLTQINDGKPYEIIEVSASDAMYSVEGMDSLYNEIRYEVEGNEIDPETVVVLKIVNSYRAPDETEVNTLILVADKLKNLYSRKDIARIVLESGGRLGKNLFEFKFHFMPDTGTIGDAVFIDDSGDEQIYDWYIAVGDEQERSKGIGSEFLRNYFAALQFLGLNNTTVQSTAHAISTFKILTRELNAVFDQNLSENMVGSFEDTYFKFSGLLFRFGLISEADFAFIRANPKDTERIKSIIDTSIENALMPEESKTQLIVRKSDELMKNVARLKRLINIYGILVNDQSVLDEIPSVNDDYAELEPYINLRKNKEFSFHNPDFLIVEQKLFGSLPLLEDRLLSYFRENPTNALDKYIDLLEYEPDSREIFNSVNAYFEESFSYTDMRGRIPLQINEANIPFAARMVLDSSLPLTGEFPADVIKQVLLSDDPVRAIDKKLSELETIAKMRITLRNLLRNIARFESSPWRKTIISEVLGYMAELGMPVKPFLSADKDYMGLFLEQPYGAWRLLSFIGSNNIKNPENIRKIINKLKSLDSEQFKIILNALSSSGQARAVKKSFSEYISLVKKGMLEPIESLRSSFGRLAVLDDENIVIGRDTSVSQHIILKGFNEKVPVSKGYNLSEKAFELVDLLAQNNIKATVVKGSVQSGSPVEFFVKIGGLTVSVKPYGPLLIESLQNETQAVRGVSDGNTLPFSNEPLLWQDISDKQGVLFQGGVALNKKDGTQYVDVTVSGLDIYSNKQIGKKSYLLRIPADRLLDFYNLSVASLDMDTAELSQIFGDVFFGLQNEQGDLAQINSFSEIFDQSFSKIIKKLDPEWMISVLHDEAENRIKSLPFSQIQDSLTAVPYAEVSLGVKQAFLDLQYNQGGKIIEKDKLARQNEEKSNFNIILFNGIPIGAVENGSISIIQDTLPDDIKGLVEKTVIHAIGVETTFLQRNNAAAQTVLPLVSLKMNDRLDWTVDPAQGIDETVIDVSRLSYDLQTALADIKYFGDVLAKLNINFGIVEGSSRLAQRSPELPDGSVTVLIDIDAFRNRTLLGFVLYHVMQDSSATNLDGYISHEATALVNDLQYFQKLMPDERNRILTAFRSDEVALGVFADLLDNARSLSQEDLIAKIISYVADEKIYPQFRSILGDMTPSETAGFVSEQINSSLSGRLARLGYNSFEILSLLSQPEAHNLENIMETIESLNQENKYGLAPNKIPEIFLGRFDKTDIANLTSIFYNQLDNSQLKPDEIDAMLELWTGLFARLGVESVGELLKSANNKESRYNLANQLLGRIDNIMDNVIIDSYTVDKQKIIEVVFEQGANNVSLKYSLTGELLSRKEAERVSYEKLLPRVIKEQTELTEHFYGQDLDHLINLMESVLQISVDEPAFADKLETVKSIFTDLSDKYHTYPRAGTLQAPVNRQKTMFSVVDQFASDLIGTPLSAARMGIGLIKRQKDKAKKRVYLKRSLNELKGIRENMVKFRMMNDYYINNARLSMVIFDKTFEKPENRMFSFLNFSANSHIETAVKQQIDNSFGNNVYAVVCEGKNPSALAWISTLRRNLSDKPDSKIAVVSTVLDSGRIEQILSSSGIDVSSLIILGNEVVNLELAGKGGNVNPLNELVNLVAVNCGISKDRLVFLAAEVNVVEDFLSNGINILPLPDIKQTPLPVRKKFPSMDIYETAA